LTQLRSDARLRTALEAVSDACRVARAVQADLARVRQMTKDDRSPVTVADFAVQAIIEMALTDGLGEAHIVGEENAEALRDESRSAILEAVVKAVRRYRPHATPDEVLAAIDACDHDATGEAYWTLDPIDGTKGFLRGEQYAVALAYLDGGEVMLGVMGCPNLPADRSRPWHAADPHGAIYAATKGGGGWQWPADDVGSEPRAVQSQPASDGAIRVAESVESAHSKHDALERVVKELGWKVEYARLDSQAKYALVARGDADAYLRIPTSKTYFEKIWDQAAGMVIANEAGAVVSDIHGAALDFNHGCRLEANRGIVCARAEIHGRIIEAIAALGLDRD
jgi:3'(2'), 5'-bisphosphate nucleotidase